MECTVEENKAYSFPIVFILQETYYALLTDSLLQQSQK